MLSINTAQKMYTAFLKGQYEKYAPGRPIAVVEFSQNETLRQSIAPLIYGAVLSPNTSTGVSPFPQDYELTDAMWGLYGFYNIRFVGQERLSSYYRSEIDPIATNPIYLIKHAGFQFYPENIGSARLSYVRKPPSIVWAYTLDFNGRPVYDPVNSQSPVWGDTDMMEIIVRALQLEGVNLQLGAVIGYAQDIKKGGQ